jgi:hypothetical protein
LSASDLDRPGFIGFHRFTQIREGGEWGARERLITDLREWAEEV